MSKIQPSSSLSDHQTRNPSQIPDGDDLPISSMAGHTPQMQNPPVQVMEQTEEHETPSPYRIPSRVFRRTNTGGQGWSGESLFSIHMGNMSFTKELEWLNNEMAGDALPPLTSNINNNNNNDACNTSNQVHDDKMSNQITSNQVHDDKTSNQITGNQVHDEKSSNQITSNQIQSNKEYKTSYKGDEIKVDKPKIASIKTGGYQMQGVKFKDMSQNVGKFHQDSDEITEAKAAEMMRQVIMETSKHYEMSRASVTPPMDDGPNHNNNGTNVSHYSNNNNDKSSYTFNP